MKYSSFAQKPDHISHSLIFKNILEPASSVLPNISGPFLIELNELCIFMVDYELSGHWSVLWLILSNLFLKPHIVWTKRQNTQAHSKYLHLKYKNVWCLLCQSCIFNFKKFLLT